MRIRIELPVEIPGNPFGGDRLVRARLASAVRNYLQDSRVVRVLSTHEVRYGVLDNYLIANLASAKSGCSPDEIYCEILLAFDYPLTIYKENNAATEESA